MAKKPRVPPTPDRVRAVSRHLHYEVVMFSKTAIWLASPEMRPPEVRNSILESFTIHTRNLSQFFFPQDSQLRDDDVVVWDYIDRTTWEARAGASLPAGLVDINTRVAKEIVHLSYVRAAKTPDEWNWDIAEIGRAMLPLIHRLMNEAPRGLFGPEWATFETARVEVVFQPAPQGGHLTQVNTPTTAIRTSG